MVARVICSALKHLGELVGHHPECAISQSDRNELFSLYRIKDGTYFSDLASNLPASICDRLKSYRDENIKKIATVVQKPYKAHLAHGSLNYEGVYELGYFGEVVAKLVKVAYCRTSTDVLMTPSECLSFLLSPTSSVLISRRTTLPS